MCSVPIQVPLLMFYVFWLTFSSMEFALCFRWFGEGVWFHFWSGDKILVRALTLQNLVFDNSMVGLHDSTHLENMSCDDVPQRFRYQLRNRIVMCVGIDVDSMFRISLRSSSMFTLRSLFYVLGDCIVIDFERKLLQKESTREHLLPHLFDPVSQQVWGEVPWPMLAFVWLHVGSCWYLVGSILNILTQF